MPSRERVQQLLDTCASFVKTITRDARGCCFRAGGATYLDEERYLQRVQVSLRAEGIEGAGVEAFLARFTSTQHFSLFLSQGALDMNKFR
jgi:hypothetical protein